MSKTPEEIKNRKNKEKIVMLTAYTYDFAHVLDEYADVLLVGDSLGMVLYGFDSTIKTTLEMMINHGKAVAKAAQKALVVVDMPYGSVEVDKEKALENTRRVIQETGAGAVKIEGGVEMSATISYLVANGIYVMAHIGMLPQRSLEYGGFKVQGKTDDAAKKIINDAIAVEKAGAFAVVIEAVKEELAKEITNILTIPTIGIGASPACDGQVLVTEDMAGLTQSNFKFIKRFGNLRDELKKSASEYEKAVKAGEFPTKEQCYSV